MIGPAIVWLICLRTRISQTACSDSPTWAHHSATLSVEYARVQPLARDRTAARDRSVSTRVWARIGARLLDKVDFYNARRNSSPLMVIL